MKPFFILILLLFIYLVSASQTLKQDDKLISGKWVRISQAGLVGLEFKADGLVEVDFGNDGSTEVTSRYAVKNDTVVFSDREGAMCPEAGSYRVEGNNCYLSFDLVDDLCNGRVKMTMGFWTRPGFEELLGELSAKLADTVNPELNLTRARIYLATGNAANARADLDVYIGHDTSNARAYINRAGTRIPGDMEGVVSDCDKAIELDPRNKNSWFLRGLAQFELGEKKKACEDFTRAIELGFSILSIAEEQRCREFWQEQE